MSSNVTCDPGCAEALDVAIAEPDHALVLRGGTSEGRPPAPYDFTWSFVLAEGPDGTTRLLMRERYSYNQPWAALLVEPIAAVSFVMSQKMLRGIRDRVEGRLLAPARLGLVGPFRR